MKKLLLSILFIVSFLNLTAQDIDLYKKDRNDNYKLPKISKEMSYEEFDLLSQNIRMKHMLYAGFVPGYVHFKINEKKKGYWLLGIRSASYITMGYVLLDGQNDLFHLDINNLDDGDVNSATASQNIFYTAFSIALATYAYDVIHGDWVLRNKQEKIRYKYAIKAGQHPTSLNFQNTIYPSMALSIQF